MNIKRKCQDSKDLGIVNVDDETVELPFYNDRTNDNFNLNDLMYINARDYPIPNNISNTPAGIYEFWKAMVFTAIEKSFSLT